MTPDFSQAEHLPKRRGERGAADPNELPRQRRGLTPQMHGRYPDFDVLEQAPHWDEATRKVVLERVHEVPDRRFFDEREWDTLRAFCDTVLAQDAEPRIPVVAYIDAKLHEGKLDGYQYADLPDDGQTWRLVARGLDAAAAERGYESFAAAPEEVRVDVCERFSHGRLHGGPWAGLNVSRAWQVVLRHAVAAFYAHPWAWNEIGFGGPAYPRGYSRFGSPHLEGGDREAWEPRPADSTDPVRETQELGLE